MTARELLTNVTIKVHFIYVGRFSSTGAPIDCIESNFETTLTPADTFTFLTRTHNPNQSQGFMFCYAKHPTTGAPAPCFSQPLRSALPILPAPMSKVP